MRDFVISFWIISVVALLLNIGGLLYIIVQPETESIVFNTVLSAIAFLIFTFGMSIYKRRKS
jgi:hypothetical protein